MRVRLLLFPALLLLAASCGRNDDVYAAAAAITGGDPQRGKIAIRRYGCGACHTIPGIRGANAVVGPSLERMGVRTYVRDHPNTPEHLIRWIRHPREQHPNTPMPDTGVTERDGRDIAAFLYTLR